MQNLELLKQDKAILLLTARQLIADFEACDLSLSFDFDKPDYAALFSQVIAVINKLTSDYPEKLFRVFYRIDLPEQLVKESLKNGNASVFLAELIIKRVLQKVILKKQYSK